MAEKETKKLEVDTSRDDSKIGSSEEERAEEVTESTSSGKIFSKTSPKFPKTPEALKKVSEEVLSKGRDAMNKAAVILPNVEPIGWKTFFILTFEAAIPVLTYILLFTTLGYGEECFSYLSNKFYDKAYIVGFVAVGFVFLLYVFDSTEWNSKCGKILADICHILAGILFVVLILFMSNDHPYGPVAFFAFVTPIWLVTLKGLFYDYIDARTYISWLSGPLFFISVVSGVTWMAWTFVRDENEWNYITRFTYADEAGCIPDFTSEKYKCCESQITAGEVCVSHSTGNKGGSFVYEEFNTSLASLMCAFDLNTTNSTLSECDECDEYTYCPEVCSEVFDECLNTFIMWVGPLMVSMMLFFLSFFTTFLRTSTGDQDFTNFGKLWVFLLFTVWVTSSLAGVAAGVASALLALTLAAFVGSGVFISASISVSEQKEYMKKLWDKLVEKYGKHLDVARGLAVIILAPMFYLYMVLSFLNQSVRKLRLPCSKQFKTEEEAGDKVTKVTRKQMSNIKSWDRSTVFTYACYWGIFFFSMNVVVAQLTVLFLSWLIEVTTPLGLGAVTGIFLLVGITMFLLPPVPGVPIYLTAGIVLLGSGREVMGIAGTICYGVGVTFVLKLLACALQQKAIGENLSRYTSVRKLVGINSDLIRSMRLVLQEPGFSAAKIGILCGGPDWPTSVLCGIMRLELIPILIGTFPVFFLIIPTVITGALTYMASLETEDGEPEFPWAGVVGTICAALAGMVQIAAMVVAAYYLEQTITMRGDEIAAIPIDEEVKELEEKEQAFEQAYKDASCWENLPCMPKLALEIALSLNCASCYLVQLFSVDCFANYQLTYTIEEHLDGDWLNLILPLGRLACLIFVVSCVFLYGFVKWAKKEAQRLLDADADAQQGKEAVDA